MRAGNVWVQVKRPRIRHAKKAMPFVEERIAGSGGGVVCSLMAAHAASFCDQRRGRTKTGDVSLAYRYSGKRLPCNPPTRDWRTANILNTGAGYAGPPSACIANLPGAPHDRTHARPGQSHHLPPSSNAARSSKLAVTLRVVGGARLQGQGVPEGRRLLDDPLLKCLWQSLCGRSPWDARPSSEGATERSRFSCAISVPQPATRFPRRRGLQIRDRMARSSRGRGHRDTEDCDEELAAHGSGAGLKNRRGLPRTSAAFRHQLTNK